jgi:hypothetical protein
MVAALHSYTHPTWLRLQIILIVIVVTIGEKGCRNTGLPAMASQRCDAILAGNPVFL